MVVVLYEEDLYWCADIMFVFGELFLCSGKKRNDGAEEVWRWSSCEKMMEGGCGLDEMMVVERCEVYVDGVWSR